MFKLTEYNFQLQLLLQLYQSFNELLFSPLLKSGRIRETAEVGRWLGEFLVLNELRGSAARGSAGRT